MQFLKAQRPERAEKNNRQEMKWKERVDAVRAERRKALGDKLEAQERARLREDLERAKKEEKQRKVISDHRGFMKKHHLCRSARKRSAACRSAVSRVSAPIVHVQICNRRQRINQSRGARI